jgi:hypothetical protein
VGLAPHNTLETRTLIDAGASPSFAILCEIVDSPLLKMGEKRLLF